MAKASFRLFRNLDADILWTMETDLVSIPVLQTSIMAPVVDDIHESQGSDVSVEQENLSYLVVAFGPACPWWD